MNGHGRIGRDVVIAVDGGKNYTYDRSVLL